MWEVILNKEFRVFFSLGIGNVRSKIEEAISFLEEELDKKMVSEGYTGIGIPHFKWRRTWHHNKNGKRIRVFQLKVSQWGKPNER